MHQKELMQRHEQQFEPTIRRADAADAALVSELAARTFYEAFASNNDPRLIAEHMALHYNPAAQLAEINDANICTLLAEVTGVAAAYTQIHAPSESNPPPSCVKDQRAVEIRRFYVDQRWHGRGVAQRLMDAAIDVVKSHGSKAVWLGVWEHNPRAVAFYKKCGFLLVGDHDFMFADERQTDLVMMRSV